MPPPDASTEPSGSSVPDENQRGLLSVSVASADTLFSSSIVMISDKDMATIDPGVEPSVPPPARMSIREYSPFSSCSISSGVEKLPLRTRPLHCVAPAISHCWVSVSKNW